MIELREAEFVAHAAEGPVRVLHPISLRLTERRVALIGANGSGKSTLARMLNGLIEPTAGEVRVRAGDAPASGADADVDTDARWLDTRRDGAAVRRLVGFVFTDPAAQLVMPTALEDIALSLRRSRSSKRERIAAARAALARFGLEELADRSVHSLSGGQQQLLAIAGVLATDPGILIADEPTTLLDLRNSRRITELLLGLPQQLIVATHDLELAARCDRVIVIADGRVVHDSIDQDGAAHDSAAQDSAAPGSDTGGGTAESAVAWYRERA